MANESENIVKGESKIIFTEMTMLVIVGLFTQLETYDLIFSVFNDHFLLFILASVAANHKTATESDVLKKNCWNIKVRSRQNWCWGRGKVITVKETEYLNTCEYGAHYENGSHYGTTIQFCSNVFDKYTTLKSTEKLTVK